MERLFHTIPPLFSADSDTLILGTFPSPKSREAAFYYGHPQNRFWRVLAGVYGEAVPTSVEEKTRLVLAHSLALWDTVASCEIVGAADSTIRRETPNDIAWLIGETRVTRIFTNGKTAFALYEKYALPKTKIGALALPSTSPANASYSLENLIEIWGEALTSPR